MTDEKRPLNRDQIAAVLAQRLEADWVVNLGVGMPTLVSNFVRPDLGITLTSENGVIGYSQLAAEGEEDPDIVNAGGQAVILQEGASFVHHGDSFALIRRGLVDVTALGAYEVACDGSFANWKTRNDEFPQLGGIGGAMDLASNARQVWLAMEHTTRDGEPRLLEHCNLPVTAPRGATLVVTDLAVVSIADGRFVLEEFAPGYTPEEIQALTSGPMIIAPDIHEIAIS